MLSTRSESCLFTPLSNHKLILGKVRQRFRAKREKRELLPIVSPPQTISFPSSGELHLTARSEPRSAASGGGGGVCPETEPPPRLGGSPDLARVRREGPSATRRHRPTIQTVMRHSSITLSMDTYGHLFPGQAEAAVNKLHATMVGPSISLLATGTEAVTTDVLLRSSTRPAPYRSAARTARTRSRSSRITSPVVSAFVI